MKKILIAEDDVAIQDLIDLYLNKEYYETIFANDGVETLEKFYNEKPDLILLDISMPKKNGMEICAEIRRTSLTPIIFVTSYDKSSDVVKGLMAGADDYVIKPFNNDILIARIEANLRFKKKQGKDELESIRIDRLEFDFRSYQIHKDNLKIYLNPKELDLLFYLVKNPNVVISPEKLYQEVWNAESFGDTLTVSVHISRIRGKIEDNPKEPKIIRTVKGKGYMFVPD